MIHHIGIYVTDRDRSAAFYESILNIQSKNWLMWNGDELLFLSGDGFRLELLQSGPIKTNTTHIAFSVPDVEEKIKNLKSRGILPADGPFHLVNGWITVFYEGPDGEEIEFIESTI
jgi:catechol 2,3-dioxygenase-like lactoylglutathione lyase family enzyme